MSVRTPSLSAPTLRVPAPTTTRPPVVPGSPLTVPGTAADGYDGTVDRPFEVFFTPHEDAYGYEARCIDEVIAARRADSTVYPSGESPYRIQYMVFNLRNDDIVQKLFEAVEAGVEVQVLVESDQIRDDRPWNKVDDWFEARGLTVLRSDKDVDAATLRGAHLVGIDKRSLMHMKSRIFHWKDPDSGESRQKVLSGSLNPGGAPVTNEENVNIMTDAAMVRRYETRFFEVRDHAQATNVWDDSQPVNVLFTPHRQGSTSPVDKLFEWIDKEQELILVSVFELHNLRARGQAETLVDKLKKAKERGVTVLAITDRRKSDGVDERGQPVMAYGRPAGDDPTDELLEAAGIRTFELCNTANPFSAVHGKSVLFGLKDMKVLTGAGNWTVAAMGSDKKTPSNDESFIFVDSKRVDDNYTGRAYLANFLHLLRKYDDQYTEQAEDLVHTLQALPGWPRVNLDLSALGRAFPGREVYLVADHPEVAARTPAGAPGIPINTSPSGSSPPFRPQDPVSLPFGSQLNYRLAVRDPATGALNMVPGDQVLVVDTHS
ncbi:MAG: phospholipase D-like domain-containing protein [Pseudomonadota bacterium]